MAKEDAKKDEDKKNAEDALKKKPEEDAAKKKTDDEAEKKADDEAGKKAEPKHQEVLANHLIQRLYKLTQAGV